MSKADPPLTPVEIVRTTAAGMWHFAEQYSRAATVVEASARKELDLSAPRFFLLGHSIELGLKAFLLAKGVALAELRSPKLMSHDLEKALTRSAGFDLIELAALSEEEIQAIRMLNTTYAAKEHEYIVTGATTRPPSNLLFSVLQKILETTHGICLEATYPT